MENIFERQARKTLEFVTGATRGGPMRLRIIQNLSRRPMNTNQMAKLLSIDYKTAEYHLRILKQNGIVVESRTGHEGKFSLSPLLRGWEKANKQRGKSKR